MTQNHFICLKKSSLNTFPIPATLYNPANCWSPFYFYILSLWECCLSRITLCIRSVQSLSRGRLFATPWTAARQASLSITNSQNLLKLMSTKSVMSSHPLSSHSPNFNLSQHQGLFQGVSSSHKWPKYWSFSFSLSPSNEYSGLISFRIDWLDLLVVQGTLKSLLQHHSSKYQLFGTHFSL